MAVTRRTKRQSPQNHASRRFSVAAVVAGSLLVSGCAGQGGGRPTDGTERVQSFVERVSGAIDGAETGGASDAQLAILREAEMTGELTFDQARQAALATIDCIEQGGGSASYDEQREPSGLVVPRGVAEAKDEESLTRLEPVIEKCMNLESFWVNNIYQLQPDSQEVRDAYRDKQAPVIRKCLGDNGYATDPEATPEELFAQAVEVSQDTDDAVRCFT